MKTIEEIRAALSHISFVVSDGISQPSMIVHEAIDELSELRKLTQGGPFVPKTQYDEVCAQLEQAQGETAATGEVANRQRRRAKEAEGSLTRAQELRASAEAQTLSLIRENERLREQAKNWEMDYWDKVVHLDEANAWAYREKNDGEAKWQVLKAENDRLRKQLENGINTATVSAEDYTYISKRANELERENEELKQYKADADAYETAMHAKLNELTRENERLGALLKGLECDCDPYAFKECAKHPNGLPVESLAYWVALSNGAEKRTGEQEIEYRLLWTKHAELQKVTDKLRADLLAKEGERTEELQAAVQREREQCARVAEGQSEWCHFTSTCDGKDINGCALSVAFAIRARGKVDSSAGTVNQDANETLESRTRLSAELDERFAKMQTPEAKAAVRKAFNATSEELGEAAVAAVHGQETSPGHENAYRTLEAKARIGEDDT